MDSNLSLFGYLVSLALVSLFLMEDGTKSGLRVAQWQSAYVYKALFGCN